MRLLREKVIAEEFDYAMLMSCLGEYQNPRDKITRLLRSGSIVRVKKGLYVFGPEYRRGPICKENLANLIYGPSYISLEYALSYYALIPERVEWVTSITSLRNKIFETPLGIFSYKHIHPKKYDAGLKLLQVDKHHSVFFASKEKALADMVASASGIMNREQMHMYLTENLRIEKDDLLALDFTSMSAIATSYRNKRVAMLCEVIRG